MKYLTLFAAIGVWIVTPACQPFHPRGKVLVEASHGPDAKQYSYKLEVSAE